MDESVLHRVVGSPAIMRAQLERLLELSDLPTVTLRVIPYDAGALPAGNNKFIILRFALPTVSVIGTRSAVACPPPPSTASTSWPPCETHLTATPGMPPIPDPP